MLHGENVATIPGCNRWAGLNSLSCHSLILFLAIDVPDVQSYMTMERGRLCQLICDSVCALCRLVRSAKQAGRERVSI